METIYFEGLEYKEMKSYTGRIWLDRNLGAKRFAKSINDAQAYGNYYTFNEIEYPKGYRLPNEDEWRVEMVSWESKNSVGAYNSPLKLPASGYRSYNSGSPFNVASLGFYWSSSVSGSNARCLYFHKSNAFMYCDYRGSGCSVRLIKE